MSAMIGNSLLLGGEGYQISRSVRLRSSATAYFNRTYGTPTNNRVWTWSAWIKRGSLSLADANHLFLASPQDVGTNPTSYSRLVFETDNTLRLQSAGSAGEAFTSSAVYRDASAWYHIVLYMDAVNTTVRAYVNGVEISYASRTNPTNTNTAVNGSGNYHRIGLFRSAEPRPFDGYLTEVNFIDGQALTPSSFGETDAVTGVWKPKKYAGTYGTNGFYLNFSDNSAATAAAIGKDYSGNGNNWTPNNINVSAYTGTPPNNTAYDSMLDVPTQWADGGNGRGNYAVLNPLRQRGANTFADANLKVTLTNVSSATAVATQALPTDSFYWEAAILTGGNSDVGIGIVASTIAEASMSVFASGGVGYYGNNGNKYINGSATAYGSSFTVGDVIGVAFNGTTITFYKNNVSQGAITLPAGSDWTPAFSNATTLTGQVIAPNFGQRPFSYTPPTGFKALNTLTLPTPTILKGNQYFDATTYTGTGASLNVVNSGGMQPDFVWTKPRSTAVGHTLFDSLRGVTKYLQSNTTGAEGTAATSLTAFNSDGFTVNSDTSTGANGVTYVGWQWKASGTTTTNTAGSITSTVSVGATQGFSIVSFTGMPTTTGTQTIGHGLGVAPNLIILKNRDLADNWYCYSSVLGNGAYILLNSTAAQATGSNIWGTTSPTSSVFTLRNGSMNTNTTQKLIGYCFADVAGFSKFGSYTGNGSADGPFVFCGFRPRYVLFKRTDSATGGEWAIYDSSRNTYNACNTELYPANSSGDETAGGASMDLLSNGFKIRNSRLGINANGGTYIYAAFAENPFKNALAR